MERAYVPKNNCNDELGEEHDERYPEFQQPIPSTRQGQQGHHFQARRVSSEEHVRDHKLALILMIKDVPHLMAPHRLQPNPKDSEGMLEIQRHKRPKHS